VHIPDGFLSTPVWVTLDAAAVPAVGYMVRRAQRGFDDAKVPLLGVMGAFVFAAQMINFPVGIGTTATCWAARCWHTPWDRPRPA